MIDYIERFKMMRFDFLGLFLGISQLSYGPPTAAFFAPLGIAWCFGRKYNNPVGDGKTQS